MSCSPGRSNVDQLWNDVYGGRGDSYPRIGSANQACCVVYEIRPADARYRVAILSGDMQRTGQVHMLTGYMQRAGQALMQQRTDVRNLVRSAKMSEFGSVK